MTTDYQAALIRRIKSRLRQEAGVPSFDPSEPCLQSQPTLEEVVVGFDPSPPQLRCRKCRGRLLAGIRSHVCIYCGAQQRNDEFPPSMSFTSTFAYRGFLNSLQLDGSEVVSLDVNTEHSIGHHATTKKETLLSELLDFELKWPPVTEVTDDNHENKVPLPHTNYANLASFNLDNFFNTTSKPVTVVDRTNGESTSDLSNEMVGISSKEFTFEVSEKIGDKAMVDISGANESSWEAEFQKAASGSQTANADVTGFLSPTVTNFFSTSKVIEGGDFGSEMQFTRQNKNKAEEPNESRHLLFSAEQRPHSVVSVSAMTENNGADQTRENDGSLDDWQDFSGSSQLFADTKRYADGTCESVANKTNFPNQTEEGDNSLDDDWQDFTGSADTPCVDSSLWAHSGGAFPHESATQVNSINANHENVVWRTIGGDASNVVHAAADSVNNSEGCNHLKERTFSHPESDAFMGENTQENNFNSLIRQGDNSLDDWQEFTGSGDMSMLSSDAWPVAGPTISQKPTELIGQIISDAGSSEMEKSTDDLKDNIEASHLKPVPISKSEFGTLFGEDTEKYKGNHLMKESKDSMDDWQHFASSRDMPASSVWPPIGSTVLQRSVEGCESTDLVLEKETSNRRCETVLQSVDAQSDEVVQVTADFTGGIVKLNQLQLPFPNSKFVTLFEGSSENHNTSDQTHEPDNSYDVWHDFASPGGPPGAASTASPLAVSAVEQESARKNESSNIVKDVESIDRKCIITQRTVNLESSSAAQIDADSTIVGEHNQSNQLSFSNDQFDAFFGGYSQNHSSNQPAKEIDDPLDDWQDFAGSGDMQAPSPSVRPNADLLGSQEPIKKTESAHMLQDTEFTNYIQSEHFSTDLHLQKSSINLNHMSPVPSLSNRIGDAGGMFDVSVSGQAVINRADETSGVFVFDSAAVSTDVNTKEKINVLTSEMHDLSFMLTSELSLPGKHKNSG